MTAHLSPEDHERAAIHRAADALVAHAADVFWKDSPFSSSSRYSYKAAAAWLHELADDADGPEVTAHWFAPDGERLSLCGDGDHNTTTDLAAVTCGWCRVDLADPGK